MPVLGQRSKINVIKNVNQTPAQFTNSLFITNPDEARNSFLDRGVVRLRLKGSPETVAKMGSKDRGDIRFEYFREAKQILEMVKEEFGDGSNFVERCYGKPIDYKQASKTINAYLSDHGLDGQITVYWAPDLNCSARMMWRGPTFRYNKPEARKYTLLLKNSPENIFLREKGIKCLMDHEIGTHFFRTKNDGLQPWYSDRNHFGLQHHSSREHLATEEGLATINTAIQAGNRFLWHAAILYYTACMAIDMTFKDLFDHLSTYIKDPNQRWRHVMRVKRCLHDPNEKGGYGNDQIYFEGAVQILRCIDDIDFTVLYSGKMSLHELKRIHRLARTDCLHLPHFIKNISEYRKVLHQMFKLNKLEDCSFPKQIKYYKKKSKKPDRKKTKKQTDNKLLSRRTSEKFQNRIENQPAAGLSTSAPTLKSSSTSTSIIRRNYLPPSKYKLH